MARKKRVPPSRDALRACREGNFFLKKTRQETGQNKRQHKTRQIQDKKPCCGIGGGAMTQEKRVLPSRAALRACREGKQN